MLETPLSSGQHQSLHREQQESWQTKTRITAEPSALEPMSEIMTVLPHRPMTGRPQRHLRIRVSRNGQACHGIKTTIRLNLQVRQRPGQQFQQSGRPAAWTVDTKTGGMVTLF